uniref:mesoderm posterior protein 1 n=1 Tax=Jaculus jaculus TaxID=51337 RepID=UPI001E1B57F4|nr:mesoderm posterior protein 1 [Jaculus jaculus]
MAQPLYAPLADSWILDRAPQPSPPPPPPSDRASSWSRDSWGSVAAGSPVPSDARPARRSGPSSGRRGARGSRLGGGQRQSASEREKLRMRTLARALHELRRFLPPSVAPAGQSLTKIETLRLAIRYIGHLSAVLGLSEDSLQRRRRRYVGAASPRSCPLCPDGGPAQAPALSPDLDPAACSGVSWESPPACPGSRDAPEPCDLSVRPSSPLFTSDVLALLETWMPVSPQEWTPA